MRKKNSGEIKDRVIKNLEIFGRVPAPSISKILESLIIPKDFKISEISEPLRCPHEALLKFFILIYIFIFSSMKSSSISLS